MLSTIRPALLVALVAAVVSVGACGGSETTDQETKAITAAQVSERFRDETGKPALKRAAGEDPAWEQFGIGLNPPPDLLRKYGIFSIYVVEPGNEQAVRSLLSDKATGEPLEADERGIYWEKDTLSGTWIANTRYGDNVVLAWSSERKKPQTDGRWERLHRMLSELEQP